MRLTCSAGPQQIQELGTGGGDDLHVAVQNMMNNIKKQQIFPQCLQECNITSLFKNKGSRKDFNCYRGVFRVSVFRNILDKLIFVDEYKNIDENLTDSNVGGRRGRNIRDNIFVLNAIINSIKRGEKKACDIAVYDIEKCFDALWAQECINVLYENGLKNDKLVILHEETLNAKIAIKTAFGISERIDIQNIIMQGSVFGSLICTAVIDKLAKIFYSDQDLLYKYNDEVEVPILGMVDDVVSVNECSTRSVKSNTTINTFIEMNKLSLAKIKCGKIHVGKKCPHCPKLYVHGADMKDTCEEKYLGDVISEDGKVDATIKARKNKAYSYLSEIRALLSDMPFGKRRVEVGLMLRDAMFVNGILCNSEAWHNISKKHIEELEVVDHQLLRHIVGAHAKVPIEFLYLETGLIPLTDTVRIRRMLFLQNILKRTDNELIKRIYVSQKAKPVKGDWVKMVNEDFVNT